MARTSLSGYMRSNRGRRLDEFPVAASGESTAAFMQRIIRGESASMVVLGDSTGVIGASPWPLRVAQWLAGQFPTHSVVYRVWNDSSAAYLAVGASTSYPTGLWPQTSSQNVSTGTGTSTITVWNGSVSGSTVAYPVSSLSRFSAMVANPAPHLVLLNYGHNSNGATGDAYRGTTFPTIRAIQQAVPMAGVAICAQNPRWADGVDTVALNMQRQRANALLAATEGLGLINFTDRFLENPNYISDWGLSDGLYVHPNSAGTQVMADEVADHLAQGIGTVPRGPSGRRNVMKLGPQDFMLASGSATLVQVNGGGMGWSCPPGALSELVAHVEIPEHWIEYDIIMKWSSSTVSASFIAWQIGYRNEGLGLTDVQLAGSILAFPGTWANLAAPPYYSKMAPGGATGYAIYGSSMATGVPVTTREVGIRISRRGDVAADDTYSAAAFLLGLVLVRRK